MRFVGIDIGAEHHVIAATDESATVWLKPTKLTEDAEGYARPQSRERWWLAECAPPVP